MLTAWRRTLLLLVCLGALLPSWAQSPQIGWGVITTVAGTGAQGYGGDRGRADQALLNFTVSANTEAEEFGHITLDAGNLYIADRGNHRVRRLDRAGVITTVAGTGAAGYSGDNGPATSADLNLPTGLAVDRAGNLYIADQRNNRVRRVDSNGIITTFVGTGSPAFGGDGGPAASASLNSPAAVALDDAGNVYIADYLNDRVRMVTAQSGRISTIAGNGQHGDLDPGRDGVPATSVRLGWPSGLAVAGTGNLYLSDHHNNVVRVVDLRSGLIRRIAGTGQHSDDNPTGDGGAATAAPLGFPMGLVLDASGDVYVADMHNNAIRRIASPLSQTPVISTPAGTGFHGFSGDGAPGWHASLDYPTGLALDANLNLWIADWHNQRIRRAAASASPPGPVIFPGGLVNGASFAPPPARVAPGSIISIFGRRLASATATADRVPLPRALLDPAVAVTAMAGSTTVAMPLFYVSPTQINAQLPLEIPHGAQASILARVGDRPGVPFLIDVSLSETGIFQYGNNRAVAVNQDGRLNTPADPAARGSFLTVYLTGQGPLDPPIATGEPAPLDRLSRSALEVAARIGGVPARVEFLGATPGFVGLSQANVVVPETAPTGDQPIQLIVGGHESNRPLITIR